MDDSQAAPAVRPPVALGCFGMAAAVVAIVGVVIFGIQYLESGTSTRVALGPAASYAPSSITFEAEHNLYIVRMGDGTFFALSDLDAANRAKPGRRCRVSLIPTDDPALPGILELHRNDFSPRAAGSTAVFRETCNGALYDATGVRLNGEGLNLDRHEYSVDDSGRLEVKTAVRHCTRHEGADYFAPVDCP
ncbi:MAG: hypothetical protein M0R74_01755 [Dehalococcoidia bacterium]|nr:hypothetical protein [Dehalococcoidia bacterium]